jgi:hypothetical protein
MVAVLLKRELRNAHKVALERPEIYKTVVRRRAVCENNTTIKAEETLHEIMHPV